MQMTKTGSFPFVPPQYVMLPPVTEHVSLHCKSLCKNIARASGGCKQYAPTKLGGGGGGTNGKDPKNHQLKILAEDITNDI